MRLLVALLLAANLVALGWAQGWLSWVLGAPGGSAREPQRMAAQVNPQTLVVLSPQAASAALAAAQAAAKASSLCLEAGPFDADRVAAAEIDIAQAVGADVGVQRIERLQAAVWTVHLGPFTQAGQKLRKEQELKRLRLAYEEVQDAPALPPGLAPGFALGRFEQREAAQNALDQWTAQGLTAARVVTLSEARTTLWLRAATADPDLSARLRGLASPALAPSGGFQPCR